MARTARVIVPGAAHHVTQRGNYGQDVFFTEDDRRFYLATLRMSAGQFGLRISAYCLMTNHIHLVATPSTETSLAKALGRTHLIYAQYVHGLHGRIGHFWQNRFYSCPMDESYAHNASIYVELNPVRAGLAAHAWDYPWSSATAHCGMGGDASGLLDLQEWFAETGAKEWKRALKSVATSAAAFERLRLHTRTGRPLGGDAFLSKVETLLGRRLPTRHPGRPTGSKDKQRRKPKSSDNEGE